MLVGARHYCSGEGCYEATDAEVGAPLPRTHSEARGLFLCQREKG